LHGRTAELSSGVLVALATSLGVLLGRATSFAAFAACARGTLALFAAFLSYLRHVLAILAHAFSSFATGFARFLRREFVRTTAFVRGTTAFAGYFTLLGFVHACKAAPVALTLFVSSVCHVRTPKNG
jgi:hypothetical protein